MTLNYITEPSSSNPIYPFILPPKYQILICQTCQYACLTSGIATYLAKKHVRIDLGTRCWQVKAIKVILGMLRSQVKLSRYSILH
jgi:uncharacterized protein (DUF2225 family)